MTVKEEPGHSNVDLSTSSSSQSSQDVASTADAPSPKLSSFNGRLKRFQYISTDTETTSRRSPRLSNNDNGSMSSTRASTSNSSNRRRKASVTDLHASASSPKSHSTAATPPSLKKRRSAGYAPPARYAHLPYLVDVLAPNLICVFVGVNPGIATATAGHAYAHPSNMFWKLLHLSGCTDRRLSPTEDRNLPQLYCMGNTNIVERPTKDQSELSKEEMAAGTPVLEDKFRKWRPEAVVIVGKGIWEAIWRWRFGRPIKKGEFTYGWQDEVHNMGKIEGEWAGSKVFVATSTSGLAANLRPAEKEEIWRPLGEFVMRRRAERAFKAEDNIKEAEIEVNEGETLQPVLKGG